jgi:pimeloyl-ACP methyl ester carboxylesterase
MVLQRQTMMAEMREMGLDPMGDLRALGYEFHDGVLRRVRGDGGFEFNGSSHYNSVADAVAQYVPMLLEEEAQLCPMWLPRGSNPGEGCPIFVSEGYECAEKLLLIIQGTGRVRAGVWGCSLCINDSLEHGTMLPYIGRALAAGYGVVVFNPNENTNDGVPVQGLENFNNHVYYVMENIVSACAAKKIDILAHSHGGRVLLSYLARAKDNNAAGALVDRLHRLVFTDSYHVQAQLATLPRRVLTLLNDPVRTVNFVPDSSPLGTQVQEWSSQEYHFTAAERGCRCVSSGVLDHAATNYASMDAVFEFFQERYDEFVKPGQLQIDRSVSFDTPEANALNCYVVPSFMNSDNNTQGMDRISGANNNDISSPTFSKRRNSSQWTRFKHYVQGALKVKCCSNVVPYSNDKIHTITL